MGRKRIGGFIFEWYSGDHEPFHIHVYEDSFFLGRFDVAHQRPMGGWNVSKRLYKALKMAGFIFDENEEK